MFLHIGNNKNVREREIIGIFDADSATVSPVTRKFLAASERRGAVRSVAEDVPKSFLLLKEKNDVCICFSQLSPAALAGRAEKQGGITN